MRKKNKTLERIQKDYLYLQNLKDAIRSSNISSSENHVSMPEPKELKEARNNSIGIIGEIKKTMELLKMQEQFWYCFD